MEHEPQPARILVADDDESDRAILTAVLERFGYHCATARDGDEVLALVPEYRPDLVFLSVMMTGMNGFEVCRALKGADATRDIPVVFLTKLWDREVKLRGLQAGANDFVTKHFDDVELLARVRNLLKVKEYSDFLRRHKEVMEGEVQKRILETNKAVADLAESRRSLKQSYRDTIIRLTIVSEFKDEATYLHIERAGRYCALAARAMGLPQDFEETIGYASPMHDIGKVAIPSDLLLKPARLRPEEYALMKIHPVVGARILARSPSKMLQMAERIAASHHERWDGTGYPLGLKAEQIPIEGRIMTLADQYDALRSARPYKPAFDHAKVFKIITEGDGRTMPSHFDPRLIEVFRTSHERFDEIFSTSVMGDRQGPALTPAFA
jgi:putative two-component system response regulator